MQTGFCIARDESYDVAIQVDGDGQHPVEQLHLLIDELRQSVAAAFPADGPGFGVIDAGLLPDQVAHLTAAGVSVVQLPEDRALPGAALRKRPALAANFGKRSLMSSIIATHRASSTSTVHKAVGVIQAPTTRFRHWPIFTSV